MAKWVHADVLDNGIAYSWPRLMWCKSVNLRLVPCEKRFLCRHPD